MQDKKIDRRVKYTKQALKDSLIEALKDKAIEKITVKELCEKADVNRGTFYSHYADQFDLYNEVIRDLVLTAIKLTDPFMDPKGAIHDKLKTAVTVFKFIKANDELIRILIENLSIFGTDKYSDMFNRMIHNVYLDDIKKNVPNARLVDMVYQYVVSANLTLIKYWLNTGMKESEEEMAILAMKLTTKGISGLM